MDSIPDGRTATEQPRLSAVLEVFTAFLRLGCTCFGGPVAHLGYFHRELVARRRWCDEAIYAEIVALAQSLPGPASSQVGFTLGILRAGWLGGLAAWLGFTSPSAALMLAFAWGESALAGPHAQAVLHGLQLAAVAVVAQAVLAMRRTLAPDLPRMALAALVAALLLAVSGFPAIAAIALGAVAGLAILRAPGASPRVAVGSSLSKTAGLAAGGAFLLLLGLAVAVGPMGTTGPVGMFSALYRAGALVFGGGHVVLPLLETTVVAPGWVSQQAFLSGYGAAQAVPGPLFSIAAYLGAKAGMQGHPAGGAPLFSLLALVGLFSPGLLAMAAVLPFWSSLRANAKFAAALAGINASVVGILMAALIRPLASSTIHGAVDLAIALLAFALLALWKRPPWVAVGAAVLASLAMSFV